MSLITPTGSRITSTPALGTLHQGPMPPWRTDDEEADYKADPRGFLLDRCALWMNEMVVYHNWIITATYYLPGSLDVPNTDRKILLPEKTHDEALWQGKVGLVVGKGRLAFKDNDYIKFDGQNVEIGDWVMYDILEGRQFTIERVHCRRLKDTQIVMTIPDPRMIY
jgi:hypothetical protein